MPIASGRFYPLKAVEHKAAATSGGDDPVTPVAGERPGDTHVLGLPWHPSLGSWHRPLQSAGSARCTVTMRWTETLLLVQRGQLQTEAVAVTLPNLLTPPMK